MSDHRLGLGQGVAIFVGAVLGPGVLALPALAAHAAGPASILAWLGLLALSVPVATTFAALGARHPDGGGVATYVTRAFGDWAAAPVGWWFYFMIPVGAPAAAWIGAQYVAPELGLGRTGVGVVTVAILCAAFGANYVGLRLSGRLQLVLAGLLVLLLLVTVLTAAPALRAGHLTPFAPHGWAAIGTAGGVLFFAFAGWEAASHLSAEFRDPHRQLPRATALTLLIVSALYLGLAVTTVGVLGATAGDTDVPLTLLLHAGIGGAAGPLTAVAAILLTLGTINTYLAGASRLGAALARDGVLPQSLAAGGGVGEAPRRSLTLLAVLTALTTVVTLQGIVHLDLLMGITSACLAAVTVAGMVAALILLPRRSSQWWAALTGAVFTGAVLTFTGTLAAVPALLGATALLVTRLLRRRRPSPIVVAAVDPAGLVLPTAPLSGAPLCVVDPAID